LLVGQRLAYGPTVDGIPVSIWRARCGRVGEGCELDLTTKVNPMPYKLCE
jgi:hypothetical protein